MRYPAVVLTLVLAACGSTAAPTPSASAPQKLNVTFGSVSYAQVALPVAKESGVFEKNGLDVNLIFGPNGIPALVAGETQVASTSTEEVISADLGGADLEIVATQNTYMQHKLIARRGINTVADLVDKPVGVTKRGNITDTALKLAAQQAGVDYSKFQIVEVGSNDKQVQALTAGAIQAAVFTPPNSDVAVAQGAHVLHDFEPERIAYSGNSMIVSRAWAQKNPSAVLAFLRSLAQASELSRTNPDLTAGVFKTWAKSDDASAATAVKLAQAIPTKAYPTPEGIKFIQQILANDRPEAATADTSRFYDDQYVKKLDAEGFYKQFTK